MTPAINIAKTNKISYKVHEYEHDPVSESYRLEAAENLNILKERVFKTLVVNLDKKELAVGIVPVSSMLNLKLIAKAAGVKKAEMTDKEDVQRSTGYVLGGVSPLGQKKRLKIFIDGSANKFETIFVSVGRRGLEIELSPGDLKILVNGIFSKLCS